MAIVTVYDPAGNAHEKESIDASECVRDCGWSMSAIVPEVPEETEETEETETVEELAPAEPAEPADEVEGVEEGPTRDEMKVFLVEREVAFAANIKQPALVKLYDAEKAKG